MQVVEKPRRVVFFGVLLALGVQHEVVSPEQEPAEVANEARHEGNDLELGGLGLRHFGRNLAVEAVEIHGAHRHVRRLGRAAGRLKQAQERKGPHRSLWRAI